MVDILKAILYGILEGVTEWLPVSSTGHLILVDKILKLRVSKATYELFQVVIQLGAILAVVLLFFRKLYPFHKGNSPELRAKTWRLWGMVLLAASPSAILGFLLDDQMTVYLRSPLVVAAMLILYGIAFLLVERRNELRPALPATVYDIGPKTALGIGCFQALSLIPGTSRSGATILGAILLGVGRGSGAEFSFFLAVPTMFGASALKAVKFAASGLCLTGMETAILVIGSAVSFLVSLLVIRGLMDYVRRRSFAPFGWYRIVLGALCFLVFAK